MVHVQVAALLLAAFGFTLPLSAQWQRRVTPADTLHSTVVLPDGKVVFQIYAPKARTVSVAGDLPWGSPVTFREMPNGTVEGVPNEVPPFAQDMFTDIIPFVEANYRVVAKPEARAVAGLSMGGMETMEVIFGHPELFRYAWVLSSSLQPGVDLQVLAPTLFR